MPSYLTKTPAEILCERIPENFLEGTVGLFVRSILAPAFCKAKDFPVGGAIAGPTESYWIDEGFQIINRVTIKAIAVFRKQACHLTENVGRQMVNLNKGENKETRVVCKKANVFAPGFGGPSDEPIPRPEMTRGGRPGHAGNRPASGIYKILQVFANRLPVPKVMVLIERAVEERFLCRTPDLPKLDQLDSRDAMLWRFGLDRIVRRPGLRNPIIVLVFGIEACGFCARRPGAFEVSQSDCCYWEIAIALWISLAVLLALLAPTARRYQNASN
jgi:hypothetical protein